jgi:hypothetical protein
VRATRGRSTGRSTRELGGARRERRQHSRLHQARSELQRELRTPVAPRARDIVVREIRADIDGIGTNQAVTRAQRKYGGTRCGERSEQRERPGRTAPSTWRTTPPTRKRAADLSGCGAPEVERPSMSGVHTLQ